MSAEIHGRALRRFAAFGTVLLSCLSVAAAQVNPTTAPSGDTAQEVTHDYMVEFYPLWFTYNQRHGPNINHMVGPNRVSPLYQIVVAINVDTLYASSFLDLSTGPMVLTVPRTKVRYSILGLDPYGDVFKTGIDTSTNGVYLLTTKDYNGPVPKTTTAIQIPYTYTILIFRADKHSSDGKDQERWAALFRKQLKLQDLAGWLKNPRGGRARIMPEIGFAKPFKTIADTMVANNPINFLEQLQTAVHGAPTPPMSEKQKALSDSFDALFNTRKQPDAFAAGAQSAHADILNDYQGHTGATQWIHFLNIGHWGPDESLDRSAITEFIQYGNDIQAAAYYQTFNDANGHPLDGTNPKGYVLKIPKDQIPEAQRFWSFTAYTPQSIELVRNSDKKYVVASYTPNLKYNKDGSITIAIARGRPKDTPEPNWLPAPKGPFNVMLRVYGPEGAVANDTYVPPAIQRQ